MSIQNNLADNVYYNFLIKKSPSSVYQYVAEREIRNVPILENPNDYEVAVARFTLPTNAIPIFVWKGDTYFQVTFTFASTIVKKYCVWQPSSTGGGFNERSIWVHQAFIDIVNKALLDGFTELKTLEPTCPATEPPFLTYNSRTQLLTWNMEQVYGDTTKVFFNSKLYLLMPSFRVFNDYVGGEYIYQMISKDLGGGINSTVINGKNYYSTKQEFVTIGIWKDFKTIIFETDNIPIDSEYTMAQANDYRRVLTDFEMVQGALQEKQIVQYYPRAEMRWYNFVSSQQMRTMDIKIYWADKLGNAYKFYVDSDFVFTLKLYMRRKIK